MEKIQKRFTRMLLGMEGLSYKERLDKLGLWSLESRRLRGDLIEVYKIMTGIDKVNGRCLFQRVWDFKNKWHIFKAVGHWMKCVGWMMWSTLSKAAEILGRAGSHVSQSRRMSHDKTPTGDLWWGWKPRLEAFRGKMGTDLMLLGLEGLSHRKRLNRLGLFSLEHQRGDLMEVYKIMRHMDR
eukprot:g42244.t1